MTREGPTPRVRDMMTPNPLVVHPEQDAEPLLGIFESRASNAVPVVDAEGNLVGVVTKLSLLRLLRPLAASPPTESGMPPQVRDVMDPRAVWVPPADSLDAVVKQMT